MKKLSRSQLKSLFGGDAPISSCTAKCANAQDVTKDCGANSSCTATDNVGVLCSDGSKKCCYDGVPCYFV